MFDRTAEAARENAEDPLDAVSKVHQQRGAFGVKNGCMTPV
jgi:hypothetical protein